MDSKIARPVMPVMPVDPNAAVVAALAATDVPARPSDDDIIAALATLEVDPEAAKKRIAEAEAKAKAEVVGWNKMLDKIELLADSKGISLEVPRLAFMAGRTFKARNSGNGFRVEKMTRGRKGGHLLNWEWRHGANSREVDEVLGLLQKKATGFVADLARQVGIGE